MVIQAFKAHLNTLNFQLSDKEIALIASKITIHKKIKRFDFLLEEGEIASNIYLILKGGVRSYIVQNGKEYCDVLGCPNQIYTNFVSFLTQQPNRYSIQALSNTELIGITRSDYYQLALTSWNIERLWRKEIERLYTYRSARDHILRLSAKERIKHLFQIRPIVFQHIPDKYIASYLRMSPETFSREFKKIKGSN